MFRPRHLLGPLLIAALAAWSAPASADLWPPPWAKPRHHRKLVTPSAPAQLFRVKGFRSAVFGMDQGQVLAAIAKDFQLPAGQVDIAVTPKERTTVLTARLTALEPGPGPAKVAYILGAGSHRLVRIAVIWESAEAPDRAALADDGMILVNYFKGQAWEKDATSGPATLSAQAVSLFSGEDPDGAAVEVAVQGAGLDANGAPTVVGSPGPAALTVTYIQDVDHPDIYRLPDGAF
jgi:hypothetical protein